MSNFTPNELFRSIYGRMEISQAAFVENALFECDISTNSTTNNIGSTNQPFGTINALNFNGQTSTISNLVVTSLTSDNLIVNTNLSVGNAIRTNNVNTLRLSSGNSILNNITSNNLVILNVSSANLYSTNISTNSLKSSFISTSNLTATNQTSVSIFVTNLTANNLVNTNLTTVNFITSNLEAFDITTANLRAVNLDGSSGNVIIEGTIDVLGAGTFAGSLETNSLSVVADSNLGGLLSVVGASTFDSTVTINGTAYANALQVSGTSSLNTLNANATTINSTLNVDGISTFVSEANFDSIVQITGELTANGGIVTTDLKCTSLENSGATTLDTLTVTGTTTLDGATSAGEITCYQLSVATNATVDGNLDVVGTSTLTGTVTTTNALNVGGNLDVAGSTTLIGETNIEGLLIGANAEFDNINALSEDVSGALAVGGTLSVTGTSTLGIVNCGALDAAATTTADLNVVGTLNVSGLSTMADVNAGNIDVGNITGLATQVGNTTTLALQATTIDVTLGGITILLGGMNIDAGDLTITAGDIHLNQVIGLGGNIYGNQLGMNQASCGALYGSIFGADYGTMSNLLSVNNNLTNINSTNLVATNATITNLYTTFTSGSFTSSSGNIINAFITNGNLVNSTITNLIVNTISFNTTSSNFNVNTSTITNLLNTNLTSTNLLNTNSTITNLIATNISSSNVTITNSSTSRNLNVYGPSSYTGSTQGQIAISTNGGEARYYCYNNNGNAEYLFGCKNSTGNFIFSKNVLSVETDLMSLDPNANLQVANSVSSGNLFGFNGTLQNSTITNLIATNTTKTNSVVTNSTNTNALITNSSITNLIATTASIGNISTGNFNVNGLILNNNAILSLNSGLSLGQNDLIEFGQSQSLNNCAILDFNYTSTGSALNSVGIGMYANNNLVVVNGNGRVGIRNTQPSFALDVNGSGRFIKTDVTNSAASLIINGPTQPSTANVSLTTTGSSVLYFGNGAVGGQMNFDYSTFIPQATSNYLPAVRFNVMDLGSANNSFNILTRVGTATGTMASRIFVDGSGNIGINTTTPNYNLDVNGNANIQLNLSVGNTIVVPNVNSLRMSTGNCILNNITSNNLRISNITCSNINLNNLTTNNVLTNNITATNLYSNSSSINNLQVNNLTSSNSLTTNATTTNLNITNATTTTLIAFSGTITNAVGVNFNSVNGTFTNSTIQNLIATTVSAGNISTGQLYVNGEIDTNTRLSILNNVVTGPNDLLYIGQSNTLNNMGIIDYNYITSGSSLNSFGLGFSSSRNTLTVQANGNVGINNTNPNYTLDVNGIINSTNLISTNATIQNLQVNNLNILTTTGNLDVTNITTVNLLSTNSTLTNFVATSTTISNIFTTSDLNVSGGNLNVAKFGNITSYSKFTNVYDTMFVGMDGIGLTGTASTGSIYTYASNITIWAGGSPTATFATNGNTYMNAISTGTLYNGNSTISNLTNINISSSNLKLTNSNTSRILQISSPGAYLGSTSGQLSISVNSGESRIHNYNNNGIAEWFNGLKSGGSTFTWTKLVSTVETDLMSLDPNANLQVSNSISSGNLYGFYGTLQNSTIQNLISTNLTSTNNIFTNITSTNLITTNITSQSVFVSGGNVNIHNNGTISSVATFTNLYDTLYVGIDGFGLTGTGTQATLYTYHSPIAFYPGGNQKVIMQTNGNVGIGTGNPGYALDVNGSINFANGIYNAGSLFYQTNTWTPGITGIFGPPSGLTVSSATGYYTRIGTQCTIYFYVQFGYTSSSSSNVIYVNNLPFGVVNHSLSDYGNGVCENGNVFLNGNSPIYTNKVRLDSTYGTVVVILNGSANECWFQTSGASGQQIYGSVTYFLL